MGTALLVVIILLVIIIASIIAMLGSVKQSRKEVAGDEFPTLSFDSQNLYRPIRSLRRAILDTVQSSGEPAVHAMSGSVTEELTTTLDRVVLALQTRDQLRKATEGHVAAQNELAQLQKSIDIAESPDEKLSFAKAYEAKQSELSEYERAKEIIKKIENEIDLTKASLSELKAKLAVTSASNSATERAEDLRTTLGALETIQSSVDEAQEMLRS